MGGPMDGPSGENLDALGLTNWRDAQEAELVNLIIFFACPPGLQFPLKPLIMQGCAITSDINIVHGYRYIYRKCNSERCCRGKKVGLIDNSSLPKTKQRP